MDKAVDEALEQLELDITTLRALITELRPAALDQLGLEPALQALIDRTRRAGMDVDAEVVLSFENGQASERHTADLETGIYRIVQEALTNASKHGAAPHATVSVLEQDGQVHVTVRDDGRGFDQTAATAGFGLAGMRERVELLGGQLRTVVGRRPGHNRHRHPAGHPAPAIGDPRDGTIGRLERLTRSYQSSRPRSRA